MTPARRGKQTPDEIKTPAQCHAAMTWAQRLKRVYGIDIETCDKCGGRVKVIACIEDPVVIRKVLYHLEQRANSTQPPPLAPSPDQP